MISYDAKKYDQWASPDFYDLSGLIWENNSLPKCIVITQSFFSVICGNHVWLLETFWLVHDPY